MSTREQASLRQNMAALEIANRIRLRNSAWKQELGKLPPTEGADRLAEVLTDDEALTSHLGAMPVMQALLAIHRVGEHTAIRMLRRAGIVSGERRLRDLTLRQREVLAFQLTDVA